MAYVYRFQDGNTHIINSGKSTLHTLCGICDDGKNQVAGEIEVGKITCSACKEAVAIVFECCTRRDIK